MPARSWPKPKPTVWIGSAKVNAEQMAREGALVTRHPLLIQKTLADKLSDKIQVIIAPPPANGDFIGATLLGGNRAAQAAAQDLSSPTEQ